MYRRKKTNDACPDKTKYKNLSRALRRTKKSLGNAQQQVTQMKEQNSALSEEALEAKIQSLPKKQQLAVRTCFRAARRKSLKGMTYDDEWVVECLLMGMRSPKLYEHLRKQSIMIRPGRSYLQKYLQRFKGGFGLNSKVFAALSEKTKSMDTFSRHEGLLLDEIKLSEHLNVKAAGYIEGFVDLGDYTNSNYKGVLADHGMVVLFQPYTGSWTQILGVFASKGNVQTATLAKIIVECTVLAERAGLYVDSVTCDGASWNHSMWRIFGIHGSAIHLRSSTKHPVDPKRQLFFVSDFPHLLKNVRNGFLSKGYLTPFGHVHRGIIETAWESDHVQ
ncbi:hypothetical protein HPB51_007968 [Rhipicephalus microplus]|uniref:Transposable element P transposase-like RNase H domain-containing protein n=1 Tax=Rhipicephalus microplus TaxID=6941 RepID=A0A9J6DFZ9_RHIMP|nr:hypothetical protein HPB51_007968 [Rhipicephalus microplus]